MEGDDLDYGMIRSLLYPVRPTVFKAEEQQRPWRTHSNSPNPKKPLLRLWDRCSGSQPEEDGHMMARASRDRLDSAELRKQSLTNHIDHGVWIPTPYISFTTSPSQIKTLANSRQQLRSRRPLMLTVVDPNVRARNDLPILDVAAEMKHYVISDPYQRQMKYYKDHYVCLWEVTEQEVVGHWRWDDLVMYEDWYQKVIMPAFENGRPLR